MPEPAVQTFGKYQIIERIATGGMAEIYKARLEGIGGFHRTFAIKRVLPHLSQNADYVAMLVDEAKVAGLLSHANIVQILDLGQVEGVWFIAMEYVNGRDLGAVMRRCSERGLILPVPHACFVAIELLKGLEYAHQRQVMRGGRPVPLNIIHRDVTPPNILLAFQGEVKLTDFGIARASLRVMETQAGVIKGRFDYMSPEQATATRDLDQRSDLFSVGVLLYEMLTGAHPFRGDNELDTLDAVREGKYRAVSEQNPDVPFALETIIDRALRADRNERFASATAFKEALDKFFHDAGFLFTQENLGSYVRSLFPEATTRKGRTAPIRDTGDVVVEVPPTEEVALLDPTEESPTRLIDTSKLRGGASLEAAIVHATPPPSAAIPPPPPTPAIVQKYQHTPDPQDETVVKPLADALSLTAAFPSADDDDAVTTVGGATPPELTDAQVTREALLPPPQAPQPLPPAPDFTPHRRSRASSLVATTLMVFGAAVIGLLIGLPIGAGGALLLDRTPLMATPQTSRLEIAAPPGARVQVNGVRVDRGVSVAPDQPQSVQVTVGETSWSGNVTVARGQTRIIVVQTPGGASE